jgi:glycine cleavage system transcriptional repressor
VGILREISTAIFDKGGNIEDISQTVVQHYFTVTLTATFDRALQPEAVEAAIRERFDPGEASVLVRHHSAPRPAHATDGERFMLILRGRDRPGILKAVTVFLADRRINIEDWRVLISGETALHIGEVTLPRTLDLKQTQADLHRTMKPLGLDSQLQHENIFRATNDIGPIKRLLSGGHP